MLEYKRTVLMSDDFRDLFKHHSYEDYVFFLICKSTEIFQGLVFSKNELQAHGECDFVDNHLTKYDAKLLMDKKQGALIGEKKNNILSWVEDVTKEINELYKRFQETQDYSFIPKTRFYGIIKERIKSVKSDENVIFFSPYPPVPDSQHCRLFYFSTDFIDVVYDSLFEEGLIGNRRVYFIYPSLEAGVYVLRNDQSQREYIAMPELEPLISFSNPKRI